MEENLVLKIAAIDHPTSTKINEITKEITLSEGLNLEVMKIIQEKLHFSYKIVQPLSNVFVLKYHNGTYGGMTGQIINQEADLSYQTYPMSKDLFNLLEYPTFIEMNPIKFVAVRKKWSSNWTTIAKPFSFKTWIAIFISLFIVSFVTSLLIRYEQKLCETRKFWSFKKTVWYLFGTCARQGSNLDSVNQFPSRFVLGIWLLSVLTLASAYLEILMSFMTAPVYEQVPKTFHDLVTAAQAQRFSCGAFNVVEKLIFKGEISGVTKILRDLIVIYDISKTNEIINRIENEPFAFISTEKHLKKIIFHITGRVVMSEDSLLILPSSYNIRKGFPYKNKIDKILVGLLESGIFDYLKTKESFKIPSDINDHEIHPMKLEELLGCFVLLIIGYILSIICFIGEILSHAGKKSGAAVNN